MLQIKKILFPTDFSACAERAVLHAAYLADRYDAELYVLNVHHPVGERLYFDDFQLSEEEIASELNMHFDPSTSRKKDAASGAPQMHNVQVEHEVPAQAILEFAEEKDVDLIVMGTHGRRGVPRLLLGSVAEEVVRLATCPVFTVRTGEELVPRRPIERLLAPIDFSEHSRVAIDYAIELAKTYDAQLHLLHVTDDASLTTAYGVEPMTNITDELARGAEEAMDELIATLDYPHVHSQVVLGHPARSILDYVDENESDLIVLSSHGRSGIERMLLGSVSEKVVRMAPSPVFTVKSFGKSLLSSDPKKAASLSSGNNRIRA